MSVTSGHLRPLPKDRDVPAWVRRAVYADCVSSVTSATPSMVALIAALEDDPATKRRRRLVVAGIAGAALASALVARQIVAQRRAEVDRRVTAALDTAGERVKAARVDAAKVRDLRKWAFEAFDGLDPDRGESLWRDARVQEGQADIAYEQAEEAFDTALVLDAARAGTEDQLGDTLAEHLLYAREVRLADRVGTLTGALARHDLRRQETRRARRARDPRAARRAADGRRVAGALRGGSIDGSARRATRGHRDDG